MKLESDQESLFNPLLELMAITGVDYTLFFRALCSFACTDVGFASSTTYDPTMLLKNQESDPTDCLGLLVKSHVQILNEEITFRSQSLVAAEIASRTTFSVDVGVSNVNLGEANTQEFEPLDLPTVEEIADMWKDWAVLYRKRLIAQLPPSKRAGDGLVEADRVRKTRLLLVNPMYCLRGSILKHVLVETEKLFPAVSEAKQPMNAMYCFINTRKNRRQSMRPEPVKHQDAFKGVQRLQKIVVDNLYGRADTSEYSVDEKKAAQVWSRIPSLV